LAFENFLINLWSTANITEITEEMHKEEWHISMRMGLFMFAVAQKDFINKYGLKNEQKN